MKKLIIIAVSLASCVALYGATISRVKIGLFNSSQARVINNSLSDAETAITATEALVSTATVVGADLASAGTGTITIQLVDSEGANTAQRMVVRTWIGQADDYGADALTDYSVTTGVEKEEVTANAEYLAITDATGLIVMSIDAGGADSVWAWAEVGGRIVSSGEVVLTAP